MLIDTDWPKAISVNKAKIRLKTRFGSDDKNVIDSFLVDKRFLLKRYKKS